MLHGAIADQTREENVYNLKMVELLIKSKRLSRSRNITAILKIFVLEGHRMKQIDRTQYSKEMLLIRREKFIQEGRRHKFCNLSTEFKSFKRIE